MGLFSSWTGGDFLLFYAMMLAFAVAASWWLPLQLRPAGREVESLDGEAAALLAGGPERFADSVVADLYARGALKEAGSGKLAVIDPSVPAGRTARAVLALSGDFDMPRVRLVVASHCELLTARLRRLGLMVTKEELTRLRWLAVAPLAVLFLIGLYRQRAGAAIGEPTGALVVLLVLTIIGAVIRIAKIDQRTEGGIATLHRLQDGAARLRLAPRADETLMAVALFGTGVLVGTPWQPVHAMRKQDGGGDSGGSSDSDGDGGGCGGGCGGCGG